MAKAKTKPKIAIDLAAVEKYAAIGLSQEKIAKKLHISPSTLYSRKRESKEFAEAIERGKLAGETVLASKAFDLAQKGNVHMLKFLLMCQYGWSEKQKIELSGENGAPVQVQNVFINDLKD
jgi:DNA-binding XRE family transcriptional regulator